MIAKNKDLVNLDKAAKLLKEAVKCLDSVSHDAPGLIAAYDIIKELSEDFERQHKDTGPQVHVR